MTSEKSRSDLEWWEVSASPVEGDVRLTWTGANPVTYSLTASEAKALGARLIVGADSAEPSIIATRLPGFGPYSMHERAMLELDAVRTGGVSLEEARGMGDADLLRVAQEAP